MEHQDLLQTFAEVAVCNAAGLSLRSPGVSYIVGLFFPLLQTALYFLRIAAHGDPLKGRAA